MYLLPTFISKFEILSKDFLEKLNDLQNSYGDGNSAKKAYEIIKSIDFKSMIAKVEDPLKVELI